MAKTAPEETYMEYLLDKKEKLRCPRCHKEMAETHCNRCGSDWTYHFITGYWCGWNAALLFMSEKATDNIVDKGETR